MHFTNEDWEIFGAPPFIAEEPCPSTVRSAWEVYVDGERVRPEELGLTELQGVSTVVPTTVVSGNQPKGKAALLAAGRAVATLASIAKTIEMGDRPSCSVDFAQQAAVRAINDALPAIEEKIADQLSTAKIIRELISCGLRGRQELEADSAWFTMMAAYA